MDERGRPKEQFFQRGVGADLRYFSGGVSASAQLDYDLIIKGFNVAALQATWQVTEATVSSRKAPMYSAV